MISIFAGISIGFIFTIIKEFSYLNYNYFKVFNWKIINNHWSYILLKGLKVTYIFIGNSNGFFYKLLKEN
jgi:hypothetical protein